MLMSVKTELPVPVTDTLGAPSLQPHSTCERAAAIVLSIAALAQQDSKRQHHFKHKQLRMTGPGSSGAGRRYGDGSEDAARSNSQSHAMSPPSPPASSTNAPSASARRIPSQRPGSHGEQLPGIAYLDQFLPENFFENARRDADFTERSPNPMHLAPAAWSPHASTSANAASAADAECRWRSTSLSPRADRPRLLPPRVPLLDTSREGAPPQLPSPSSPWHSAPGASPSLSAHTEPRGSFSSLPGAAMQLDRSPEPSSLAGPSFFRSPGGTPLRRQRSSSQSALSGRSAFAHGVERPSLQYMYSARPRSRPHGPPHYASHAHGHGRSEPRHSPPTLRHHPYSASASTSTSASSSYYSLPSESSSRMHSVSPGGHGHAHGHSHSHGQGHGHGHAYGAHSPPAPWQPSQPYSHGHQHASAPPAPLPHLHGAPAYGPHAHAHAHQQHQQHQQHAADGAPGSGEFPPTAPRRRGKLPKEVTETLRTWLLDHVGHPYPTEEEKRQLCERTGLTMSQISNWFINARRRILTPADSAAAASGAQGDAAGGKGSVAAASSGSTSPSPSPSADNDADSRGSKSPYA